MVPALTAREPATMAARHIPDATIADFHRTGILRVVQPRRFGGLQASFGVFSRIIEILAEGCAASAWVYAVLGEHQWIIACMPEQAQIDVWGSNPLGLASSSLAPRETARAVAGGWRLSGRFPFSSGCLHAQWAIIGARCEDAAGNQPTRYVLVPMREIEIIDDWEVLGLRGTGSRSLLLNDVFVPAHRSVLLRDLFDGTTPGALVHPDYPLLRRAARLAGAILAAGGRIHAGAAGAGSRRRLVAHPGFPRRSRDGRFRGRATATRRGGRGD